MHHLFLEEYQWYKRAFPYCARRYAAFLVSPLTTLTLLCWISLVVSIKCQINLFFRKLWKNYPLELGLRLHLDILLVLFSSSNPDITPLALSHDFFSKIIITCTWHHRYLQRLTDAISNASHHNLNNNWQVLLVYAASNEYCIPYQKWIKKISCFTLTQTSVLPAVYFFSYWL